MKNSLLISFIIAILFLVSCGSDDDGMSNNDNQNPTAPQELIASNITENSFDLNWSAATDNVEVTNYKLYVDGTNVQTINNETTAIVLGLTPGTSYDINVTALDAEGNESNQSNSLIVETLVAPLIFKNYLSEMGVFSGDLKSLTPAENVHLYDLNSQLFTDYAHKQRLIRMPEGEAMQYDNNSLLPIFPDNTLISKTFYYYEDESNTNSNKIIIETRVLIKTQGTWKVGEYLWNNEMNEAVYTEQGSTTPITYLNTEGVTQEVQYQIPSKDDCITCHHIYDDTTPIGPKLRAMNFKPQNEETSINQLQYFIDIGLLEGISDISSIEVLADWEDEINFDIFERGRSYIDINCAHCHQPGGYVPTGFLLDFRLETDFVTTGIYSHRGQIESRIQSTTPTYLMPQLGRSLVHDEGVTMLLEYLEAIED
jgi:uncharacterized repeat protein (TIGR03806 family)